MLYEVTGTIFLAADTNNGGESFNVPTFYISSDKGIKAALAQAKQVVNPIGDKDITPHLCIVTLFENNGEQLSIKNQAPVRRHGGEHRYPAS